MATLTAGSESNGLILRSHWEPGSYDPWVEVVHAAPRALFGGDLLRRCHRGEALPFTEVDHVGVGGLVRINARDRRLVYRLVEHDELHDVYAGEWPD